MHGEQWNRTGEHVLTACGRTARCRRSPEQVIAGTRSAAGSGKVAADVGGVGRHLQPGATRSRMLTMPTSRSPSTTGMWRNRRSVMIRAASLGE